MWPLLIPRQVLTVELGPLDEEISSKRSRSPKKTNQEFTNYELAEVVSAEVDHGHWSKWTRGARSRSSKT
jgi:hypothetical protein